MIIRILLTQLSYLIRSHYSILLYQYPYLWGMRIINNKVQRPKKNDTVKESFFILGYYRNRGSRSSSTPPTGTRYAWVAEHLT